MKANGQKQITILAIFVATMVASIGSISQAQALRMGTKVVREKIEHFRADGVDEGGDASEADDSGATEGAPGERRVVRIRAQVRETARTARGIAGVDINILLGRVGQFRNKAAVTTDDRGNLLVEFDVEPTDRLIRVSFPGNEEYRRSLLQIRNPFYEGPR